MSRELIVFYIIDPTWGKLTAYRSDSVIEMQAFLVNVVRRFDISYADHHPQIKRVKIGVMVPLVLGEEYKGTQLPLRITAIGDT